MESIAHSEAIINMLVSLVIVLIAFAWGKPQKHTLNHSVKLPEPARTITKAANADSILVQWHGGFKVIEVTR